MVLNIEQDICKLELGYVTRTDYSNRIVIPMLLVHLSGYYIYWKVVGAGMALAMQRERVAILAS